MNNFKLISYLIVFILILLMLFGSKKVRLNIIFLYQVKVFENAKNGKISIWDITCFVLFPIILSILLVFEFKIIVDRSLSMTFTTVFSFIFTVLFGFAGILAGRKQTNENLEDEVAREAFITISFTNILSLISMILSIIISQIENVNFIKKILSVSIFSISFMIIMLLIMITKRICILYVEGK